MPSVLLPSVGGAVPKLLLSIPGDGWDGRIALPTKKSTNDRTDIILKFEQSNQYPGIIDLEALALDMHKEAGFDVPRYWKTSINGINALAIERFDRNEFNKPVFMERLYRLWPVVIKALPIITAHPMTVLPMLSIKFPHLLCMTR